MGFPTTSKKKVRIRDLELLAESGYPDAQSKLKHDAIPTIFNLPPAKDVAENPIRRPWLSKSSRRGAFEKRGKKQMYSRSWFIYVVKLSNRFFFLRVIDRQTKTGDVIRIFFYQIKR